MKFSNVQTQPSMEGMECKEVIDLRSKHKILIKKMLDNQKELNGKLLNELRDRSTSFCEKKKHATSLHDTVQNDIIKTWQMEIAKLSNELECRNIELANRDTTLQEQFVQIQNLEQEIKRKDFEMKKKDIEKEQLDQYLFESLAKEATLQKTTSDFSFNIEGKNDEISKLKQQLLTKSDTEDELENAQNALKIQKKIAERELKQYKQDIKNENEKLNERLLQMNKHIECLTSELKDKSAALKASQAQNKQALKLKIEHENDMKGKLNKQRMCIEGLQREIEENNIQIKNMKQELKRSKDLQEEFNQSLKEKRELKSALEMTIKAKSDLDLEVKCQQNELLHRESALRDTINLLQKTLKDAETELEKRSHEQGETKEKIKEIKRLKLEVQEQETSSLKYHVQFLDAIKQKEENEKSMNELIRSQNRQITLLKGEIEKKYSDINDMDQVVKRNEHLQNEIVRSQKREASFSKSVEELRNKTEEDEKEISELKQHVNDILEASRQRENKLKYTHDSLQTKLEEAKTENNLKEAKQENINRALQVKLRNMETQLRQFEIDKSDKKGMARSVTEMNIYIERLELEVKKKEAELQDYDVKYQDAIEHQEKTKSALTDLDNKQKRNIQHLQEEIEIRDIKIKKDVALAKTVIELQNRNQEQENQIADLKHQLNEIQETLHQRESKLQNVTVALQGQLYKADTEETPCRHETSKVNNSTYRMQKQIEEKNKEIERLNQELNQLNEIAGTAKKTDELNFGNKIVLLQDAIKEKEMTESEFNIIINNQKRHIQQLQDEINKQTIEVSKIDEVRSQSKQFEYALQQSHEKEASLRETIEILQVKNNRNENQISIMTKEINEISERFIQKESKLKNANEDLQEKITSVEAELEQQKQEVDNKRRFLKSAQMKMTEMSKEIDILIKEKTMNEKENQSREDHFRGIIDSQGKKIKNLEMTIQKHDKIVKDGDGSTNEETKEGDDKLSHLKDQLKHTLAKLHKTETELDETKSRLSRAMGDRLTDNNPNITDLSDRNRPTKIAEKCAELYDNQWTDAYDVLENHFHTEEVVIEVLLHILQDVMSFCQTMAHRQMVIVKQEISFSEQEGSEKPSDIQKLLKDLRKAVAGDVVVNLKKIYVSQLEQSEDKVLKAALDVDEYTAECVEICWFMVIQDPPVVFGPLPKEGSNFDTDLFRSYTKSGAQVEYSVWPTLLLHEGGPILSKGVAQGFGKKT